MKVLLVIDIQNDFMPGGSLAVKEADTIIPKINQLIEEFPIVIASQDYHPKIHYSFASTHGRKIGDLLDENGHVQLLWPEHCIQGSKGAEFHKDLYQGGIDFIIKKGTDPHIDSYSAFFDNQRKKDTGLNRLLTQLGASELTIVGVATDYCVKYTALDALELGYKVIIKTSCCKGVNAKKGDVEKAIEELRSKGAIIE